MTAVREEIEAQLFSIHGPVIGGEALWKALAYPSAEAFRQAIARKQIRVPIFPLEHRRGRYALVKDVATWLALQREMAEAQGPPPQPATDGHERAPPSFRRPRRSANEGAP